MSTSLPGAAAHALDRKLLHAYHACGDRAARERLIERHLPLVRRLASRYRTSGEPSDDLVHAVYAPRSIKTGGATLVTESRPEIANAIAVRGPRRPRFALVARSETRTNIRLLDAVAGLGFDAERLPPSAVPGRFRRGDIVLGRIDVLPGLDGVEPGLWALRRLEREPVRVLNAATALLACHDKLATALALASSGLPHPQSARVDDVAAPPPLDFPVVVKPRFGSWGRDVALCDSTDEFHDCLNRYHSRPWFQRHGALVQEFVPSLGRDLRVVVACGRVVGAVERESAPGEWRTNVALGAARRPVKPPAEACLLAVSAATAVGADFVGVDLLPRPGGGWVVLELNGAVDFTDEYSAPHIGSVFREAARRICAEAEPVPISFVSEP
jgi:RimK family alpha-L-glutamate ligase